MERVLVAKLAFFDHFWRKLRNLLCCGEIYDAVGSVSCGAGSDPTASDRPLFGRGLIRRGRIAPLSAGGRSDTGEIGGFSAGLRSDGVGSADFGAVSDSTRSG
jgi:hypothetical protein